MNTNEATSESFSSTKKKEAAGLEWLKGHLEEKLPGASLESTTNKTRASKNAVADAILSYGGERFHLEIKVIGKAIPTNIRFTHQTVTKARGKDLIVALIYNFDNRENTNVKFFRLGSVVSSILVEPHFIVQKESLLSALRDIDALGDMLRGNPVPLDLPSLDCKNENNRWHLKIEWEEKNASPS